MNRDEYTTHLLENGTEVTINLVPQGGLSYAGRVYMPKVQTSELKVSAPKEPIIIGPQGKVDMAYATTRNVAQVLMDIRTGGITNTTSPYDFSDT
jgi:hypothetical protein